MRRTDIVIGIVVLIILAVGLLLLRNQSAPVLNNIPYPSPDNSIQSKIESQFNVTIPDNVDKAELKSVKGDSSSGIATREYENNLYTATILADLPDPEAGQFYQAWIYSDSDSPISLGRMSVAKGGWMLDYQSKNDYSQVNNVLVTSEKILDKTPETHILEGSF